MTNSRTENEPKKSCDALPVFLQNIWKNTTQECYKYYVGTNNTENEPKDSCDALPVFS